MQVQPSTFTLHIYASGGCYDLDLMVEPDADLDGTFKAWCNDENEYLSVNGWLFTIKQA